MTEPIQRIKNKCEQYEEDMVEEPEFHAILEFIWRAAAEVSNEVKEAFTAGYEVGHNDTVESRYGDPEEAGKFYFASLETLDGRTAATSRPVSESTPAGKPLDPAPTVCPRCVELEGRAALDRSIQALAKAEGARAGKPVVE